MGEGRAESGSWHSEGPPTLGVGEFPLVKSLEVL